MVKSLAEVVAASRERVVNASCHYNKSPQTGVPTTLIGYARPNFVPAPIGFPMEWVEVLVSDQKVEKEPTVKPFIKAQFGGKNLTVEQLIQRKNFNQGIVEALTHHQEVLKRIRKLEAELGFCFDCGKMYSHFLDSPFASCGCKQSEWYEFTPYMKLEKKLFELHLPTDKEQK